MQFWPSCEFDLRALRSLAFFTELAKNSLAISMRYWLSHVFYTAVESSGVLFDFADYILEMHLSEHAHARDN